jgi:hypothetical protein
LTKQAARATQSLLPLVAALLLLLLLHMPSLLQLGCLRALMRCLILK